MIISPPFLLEPDISESDDDFIARCMPNTTVMVQEAAVPEGSFPVSFKLGWHGGLHLRAPTDSSGAVQSVRAIADGEIVFVRKPKPQNNTPSPEEPLNYNPYGDDPSWTDNGCVIIRHTTDIGADAQDKVVSVTFLSIYLHLSELRGPAHTVAAGGQNRKIYRKDEIGIAGMVYGAHDQLHFEIVCDDENLKNLINRTSGNVDVSAQGRSNVLFGEVYFRLPQETKFYAEKPRDDSPDAKCTATNTSLSATYTSTKTLYVGLRYTSNGKFADRGMAELTTYQEDGVLVGDGALSETAGEYNLYNRANAISEAYPAGNRPIPSVVYELLRLGRSIGAETTVPVDTPHWRKVRYPGGEGWVNLNATGVNKFSDADFPQWRGWELIDDDSNADSRCDSAMLFELISYKSKQNMDSATESLAQSPVQTTADDAVNEDSKEKKQAQDAGASETKFNSESNFDKSSARTADKGDVSREEKDQSVDESKKTVGEKLYRSRLIKRLKSEEVRLAFKRMICKFPTELDRSNGESRWGWLKSDPEFGLEGTNFDHFLANVNALAVPWSSADVGDPTATANCGIPTSHWHFEPREFISIWRKCRWLSKRELLQMVPSHAIRTHDGNLWEQVPLPSNSVIANAMLPTINRMLRKYGIDTPMRQAGFFGNSIQETGWFSLLAEGAPGGRYYAPWYGRGLLQLTHPDNYIAYWRWRGRSVPTALESALRNAEIHAKAVGNNAGLQDSNFSALTAEMINWRKAVDHTAMPPANPDNIFAPADSAGYYWVALRMAKYADAGSTQTMERYAVQTNHGQKVYYRSQGFWKVSASVNLPGQINNSQYSGLYGFDSRCCAYGVATFVLTERWLPNAQGQKSEQYPEGYTKRFL